MQTIEGKILNIRNLGGIIFFTILHNNLKQQLIANKEDIDENEYKKIKDIKIYDFCRFDVEERHYELTICTLLLIIKSNNSQWTVNRMDNLRSYSYLLQLTREYFTKTGYLEARLPVIHYGNDKDEIFPLEFFNSPSRLTSSNSLYLNAYAAQIGKVFTLQKCFRAEHSHTNKHLAEFDMLEMAAVGISMEKCMMELEAYIKYVVKCFGNNDLQSLLNIDVDTILNSEFPKVEYEDIKKKHNLKSGLGKIERNIAENIPTFVIHMPYRIGSWMAKPYDKDYSYSFNLLVPQIGEIAEGNQKQTDLHLLGKKFDSANVKYQLNWYIETMPYSDFDLSGFGLGLERLLMWLIGLRNIREINPFYRDMTFAEFNGEGNG